MKPEVAWAMRPTGSLSNLYLTDEQLKAVYAWLDMLAGYTLDEAREAVAALVRYDHNNYALVLHPDGWAIDRDEAIAAIDALKEKP